MMQDAQRAGEDREDRGVGVAHNSYEDGRQAGQWIGSGCAGRQAGERGDPDPEQGVALSGYIPPSTKTATSLLALHNC